MQNENKDIKKIVNKILKDYQGDREIDNVELFDQPDTRLEKMSFYNLSRNQPL